MSIMGIKVNRNYKIIPLFKKDVFHTNYGKRVLISYITDPFYTKNNLSHTNQLECYTAAKIFSKLEYDVDVIDISSKKNINYSKYDIIYGMGDHFENSFYYTDKKIKRIFYATGCNPIYSNIQTILKIRDFNISHDKLIMTSSRFTEKNPDLQILLSDKVIVLGGKFALNTYKETDKSGEDRYVNLNAFFYDTYDIDLTKKDFHEAKKHFLWFGSSGLLHKGLDTLIDIFSKRKDIYLHICGASSNEKEFFDFYSPILKESENIINHGFVDIRSNKYKEVVDQCAFTISPSISEGGSPAILNTIANGGLIPIITKASSLDIDDVSIIIKEPKLDLIKYAIEKALELDTEQISKISTLAKDKIRNNYTLSEYEKNLEILIRNSIL